VAGNSKHDPFTRGDSMGQWNWLPILEDLVDIVLLGSNSAEQKAGSRFRTEAHQTVPATLIIEV
jgi:hypothetical protein